MRQTCIFSGSSHPQLVEAICARLGSQPSQVALRKFSNGETSVEIKTSVRDQDVFIVQSGSSEINDNVMEMLIMISACKGGSARSITAVMPYFPYSRQSKKKAHRGAITARMLANLMKVAGVNHVITIDLHASQSQGFFKCPVDNLFAEPILARWVKNYVPDWQDCVIVSKNPGGTKRVTSLADKLGLSFGIVGTERKRYHGGDRSSMMNSVMYGSAILERLGGDGTNDSQSLVEEAFESRLPSPERRPAEKDINAPKEKDWAPSGTSSPRSNGTHNRILPIRTNHRSRLGNVEGASSPLAYSSRPDSHDGTEGEEKEDEKEEKEVEKEGKSDGPELKRSQTALGTSSTYAAHQRVDEDGYEEPENEDDTDELARDVITGRLIHGHIVDDDAPSPAFSAFDRQRQSSDDEPPDLMTQSFMSTTSSRWGAANHNNALGGTGDATASDEEEEEALANPHLETTVTLVGNVRDKPVIIVDDMIDKAASWIAAAETVVKRGGATKVYCVATHGLFGGNALAELDQCEEITSVVVTNAFPIDEERQRHNKKLTVLDVSGLLSEAIRRNHHGESISQLYWAAD
ncbi:ribose-phosphate PYROPHOSPHOKINASE pyrophosphate synthetase [Dissoconium aciculare CBS 342.82]|uniref:Ribose-phosphate pyrophosphokinase 1 n=1 Tax=Dissoconium aciculare CBS 342.82 TaxID=1314786 RepID=A0A6J3LQT7_9PEZI|nr:ribose-phosphate PYROPHOSPHOKINASE pyrophosphate synthetase [Dissoconium aciculare CBS 342.82]KAF1818236.1 ribose-phosphate PYROPHOSPHOKINASE pyrophosphate synthetase [Dissoconium aciculare CBS 342.82]